MKTAIVYTSKYNTTEAIAEMIAQELNQSSEVKLFNLKTEKNPDISKFDRVILGTAIYAGQPRKKMKQYCKEQLFQLTSKPLYLFVGGMEPNIDKQQEEIKNAYPEPLQNHANGKYFLGGAFQFEKMNFIEKALIKKIAKTDKNVESIHQENLQKLISDLKR